MYYATGAMHSPETGSPEMLMELAYRLAVDEAPYILFYQANQIMALRDNLDGFEVRPGGSQYMTYERYTKR